MQAMPELTEASKRITIEESKEALNADFSAMVPRSGLAKSVDVGNESVVI
jgi:hypothetical protein